MVFNICVKFHEISHTVLMLQSGHDVCGRNGNFRCLKSNNSKSMQSRVTVSVLCTLAYGPEHLCEVS